MWKTILFYWEHVLTRYTRMLTLCVCVYTHVCLCIPKDTEGLTLLSLSLPHAGKSLLTYNPHT